MPHGMLGSAEPRHQRNLTRPFPAIGSQKGRVWLRETRWEQRWIADAELVFREKTGTGDYYQEMNTKHFMEWFEKKLIPNCPPRSVIVLDNTKYLIAVSVVEKIPTKKAMMDYLIWTVTTSHTTNNAQSRNLHAY